MEENSKADEQASNNYLLLTDDSSSEDSDGSFSYGESIDETEAHCKNSNNCGLNNGMGNVDMPSESIGYSFPMLYNRTNYELGPIKSEKNEKINDLVNSKIPKSDLRPNPVPNLQIDRNSNGNYKCPKCNYISNLKHDHEIHLTTHLLIKPFACLFCSYESFYVHDLESHKKEHKEYDIPLRKFDLKLESNRPVTLPQNLNLCTDAETNNHWQIRTASTKYETSIKSVTPSLSSPKSGNLNLKEPIFCFHCKFSTSTNFALKRHYNDNHPKVNRELLGTVITNIDQNGIRVFSCPLCPFACGNFRSWCCHWPVHSKGDKNISNSIVYRCHKSKCPFKTLSVCSFSKHKKTH